MSWKRRRRSQRASTVCIMVENIMSSMARVIGYDGAMCCKKKKLMTMLELGQPRVVVIMRG